MQLKINRIKKSFGSHHVLADCTMSFDQSTITGVLGRNGVGKTTLFNILYGELSADEGEATLVFDDGTERALQMDDIGMLFAETVLPEFLTGYEFVRFYLDLHQAPGQWQAEEYLDLVDINQEDRYRLIKGYSSGMKSKLALISLLILQPPVILLDEPLAAVDIVVQAQMKQVLREMKKDRIILLSTHIVSLAQELADEVVLLKDGRLHALDYAPKEPNFEAKLVEALTVGEDPTTIAQIKAGQEQAQAAQKEQMAQLEDHVQPLEISDVRDQKHSTEGDD
ncbi:MAG: ABC transporter ATP-binding protein [Aerococcus sp.]|nr:ABC transporter ATP-binding protein [Aerococcus sp.]